MSWFSSSDQPDSQPDPESELRSLELFTPTGADRAMALSVLRRFTEATADGRTEEAQAVLDAVEPEAPTGPTMPQVLGASVGLLDTWFSDRRYRSALSSVRAAARRRPVRACASDLLAAVRKGGGYASIDDLSIRHGGLAMFEAAATLVSASVAAIAKGQRTSVPLAGRELLIADTDYTGAKLAPQGRGIGYSGFTPADDRMVEAFGAWLSEQDDITGPDPDQEKELLQSILALTRVAGIDLHNPNDMEAVLGFVDDLDADDQTPAGATTAFLLTLDDYVHFQWERARSPEAWERADEAVEAELGASDEDADQVVDDAISATRQVDPAIRRTTLMGTLAVTAVRDILGWVGKSRPVTATGNLRLADIEPVAAMLGIRAEGVRSTTGLEEPYDDTMDMESPIPDPPVYYARTLREVPVLHAWWTAVCASEILETTARTVRPGPQAQAWLAEGGPSLETLEDFAGFVVALVLSVSTDSDAADIRTLATRIALKAAGRTIVAATEGLMMPEVPDEENWDVPILLQRLVWLRNLGLLETDPSGEFRAPEGTRAAVADGALRVLQNTEPDWDEGLEEGWDEGLDD